MGDFSCIFTLNPWVGGPKPLYTLIGGLLPCGGVRPIGLKEHFIKTLLIPEKKGLYPIVD